ncbi:discoidin domain-containing protein [Paenibacillus sp. GYB004]|uniref:discoidin domain-containing protein n=1 Tax=Paenibacillus sp. GYB004 TaxID=2994393 RepID=UPI002F960EAA
MKKWIAALSLPVLCLFVFALRTEAAIDYSGIIETEASWIADQQIQNEGKPSDGAIVMNKNQLTTNPDTGQKGHKIDPYFSNLSVIGMLEHPSADHMAAAKKWFDWYFRHLNRTPDTHGVTGTVYVYYVNSANLDEQWTFNDYSASDSRGSSFVLALKKYVEVSQDTAYLQQHKADIELALESALFTLQPDGLSFAKNQEGHFTKYLQDNALVYQSLETMVWLEEQVFQDEEAAARYRYLMNLSFAGVESMYRQAEREYYFYFTPNRIRATDWSVFYGDAVSELFPTRYGVISPQAERSRELYAHFNAAQPAWMYRHERNEFPWTQVASVAAMMGDKFRVDEALTNAQTNYIDNGHQWTWYIYEASNMVTAAKTIRDQTNLALRRPISASTDVSHAGLAVDGDMNGGWQGASSAEDWLEIDLGANKTFNRLVLKWGSTYAASYKVRISDDGSQFADIYTQTAGDRGTDDIALNSAVTGRYVRLLIYHDLPEPTAIVKEIELYHEAVNAAGGQTVSASSQESGASLLTDGNPSTAWTSDSGASHWLKLDLGNIQAFHKVKLDWVYGQEAEQVRVLVSDDDISYTEAAPLSEVEGWTQEITLGAAGGRYVLLELTKSANPGAVALFEIRVLDGENPVERAPQAYTVLISGSVIDGAILRPGEDDFIGSADLYVPVEKVARATGWTFAQDNGGQTVTLTRGDRTIGLAVGSSSLIADGNPIALAAPTAVRNGRVEVPLQGYAAAARLLVEWSNDSLSVLVKTQRDPSKINLALGKPATVSNPPSTNTAVLTDGVKTVSKIAETWNVRAGYSLVLDLGQAVDFNTFKAYEYSFQRARGAILEYSLDGASWTLLKNASASELLSPDMESKNHYSGTIRFQTVNARYIRLTVQSIVDPDPSKIVGYIEEVEVYNRPAGDGEDESHGNVAYRRPASTSFAFSAGDMGVTKVTDGDLTTKLANPASENETEGCVQIDLQAAATFNKVVVFQELQRIKKYRVLVSPDSINWMAVAAGEGIGNQKELLFAPVTARYIRLELAEAEPGIRIREIQAFNESDLVTYPDGPPPPLPAIPVLPAPQTVASVTYSKEDFHIYLFIGQSNMNGRDLIPFADQVVVDYAYLLNAADQWEYAQPYALPGPKADVQGFNRYSSVDTGTYNGMNPSLSFARAVTESVYPQAAQASGLSRTPGAAPASGSGKRHPGSNCTKKL